MPRAGTCGAADTELPDCAWGCIPAADCEIPAADCELVMSTVTGR